MLNETKIQRRFPSKRNLSDEEMRNQNDILEIYRDFARFLDSKLPDGRLKALTMTHLENSGMFAMKSIEDEANAKIVRAMKKEENVNTDSE